MLKVTAEVRCQNSGCTCKGHTRNVRNGHALLACFAVQVTSGAKPIDNTGPWSRDELAGIWLCLVSVKERQTERERESGRDRERDTERETERVLCKSGRL